MYNNDLARLLQSFTPDVSETYTTICRKVADYIQGLNLAEANLNRLVLLHYIPGTTKAIYPIAKYNITTGYYTFEGPTNGKEINTFDCRITGNPTASKYTHLLFNSSNNTWTYGEETDTPYSNRVIELYLV